MAMGRRLLSQSGALFVARLSGAGITFVAQVAIVRLWGAGTLGQYLLIIAVVNIVGVILPLGFQTVGSYFAAEYRAEGQGTLLRRFLFRTYGHVALMAALLLVVGPALLGGLGPSAQVLATHWLPAWAMTVAVGISYCNVALLVGLKRPFAGYFAEALFRPLLIVSAVLVATLAAAPGLRLDAMLWMLALGFGLVVLLQSGLVVASVRAIPATAAPRPGESRRWWRFALPWVVIALATDFFFDIDLVVLSGYLDHADLAVFGVAARVFSLVSFGVAAVYAVTLPEMFEREAEADRAGFMTQLGDANLVASAVSLALLAAVVAAAPLLPLVFGAEFSAGIWPLAVLCLSLLVRSAFGPAALVLSMHDKPYASLPAIGLGLGALLGLNWLLVPAHGLLGAALAALLAQSLWSAAMWLTARRLAGVDVSVLPRLRALVGQERLAHRD
ncbi:MAG: polysaccharide biosynthesis C-terminal domain-containing protein [Devosia sp.]|nr:polysaccharide biosynthesis C-terminal domain-containing protein [Devosia sp.]